MSSEKKECPRNRVFLGDQDFDPLVSSEKTVNLATPLDLRRRTDRGQAQRIADPGHSQQPVKPPILTVFQATRRGVKGLVGRPNMLSPRII